MGWALGLGLIQWVLAYLALDLTFRRIHLHPSRLKGEVSRWRRRYLLSAAAAALVGGTAQALTGGVPGTFLALLGPLPWWILWRFGWRKQFTFLFKDDGGTSK